MIAMLLQGGPDLPDKLAHISPWIDVSLGDSAEDVTRRLDALPGRRVVKTHTPGDGFPVWEDVFIVAVYRHPLDVFFSLRKHIANRNGLEDHPMRAPVPEALQTFLDKPMDPSDFDDDTLEGITHHHAQTVLAARHPGLIALHYNDMIADPIGALSHLARQTQIDVSEDAVQAIAAATQIDAMRADATKYAPFGGSDVWKDDTAFFATGKSGSWQGKISDEDYRTYQDRLAVLEPDATARAWLETGNGQPYDR